MISAKRNKAGEVTISGLENNRYHITLGEKDISIINLDTNTFFREGIRCRVKNVGRGIGEGEMNNAERTMLYIVFTYVILKILFWIMKLS